jgi:hypothetical protein
MHRNRLAGAGLCVFALVSLADSLPGAIGVVDGGSGVDVALALGAFGGVAVLAAGLWAVFRPRAYGNVQLSRMLVAVIWISALTLFAFEIA